jgi:hypothetical protein
MPEILSGVDGMSEVYTICLRFEKAEMKRRKGEKGRRGGRLFPFSPPH